MVLPNSHLAWICISIAVVCSGCSSLNREVITAEPQTFSEQEITSRAWEDAQGQRLGLLDRVLIDVTAGQELLIAKYGDVKTRTITCLDFYQVIHQGQGRIAVTPSASPATASSQAAPVYKVVPDPVFYDLLLHDYRPEIVTRVETRKGPGETVIGIVRQTLPGADKEQYELHYKVVYDGRWRMHRDPEIGYSPIGSKNATPVK
jgi:hypothetical protein